MTSRTIALIALALSACAPTSPPQDTEVARLSVDLLDEQPVQTEEFAALWEPLPEPEPLAPSASETVLVLGGEAVLTEETRSYALRRGETLAHFARWAEEPIERVAERSGLDLEGRYPVGTEVLLTGSAEALASVERAREQHAEGRLRRYLSSRGGEVGTATYTVRTGDTAWSIAKQEQGVPVWVLESYNPDTALDRLRPGQVLEVPVLADIVVDADQIER
ncbi:MAG: LysM peptidoglycan-binding domain-containing protein [Deltaproteobacteria bacterium]|nr:LysM peptidoglycan-binding domain-containing protein [Deltaproteobacteria bacterium]